MIDRKRRPMLARMAATYREYWRINVLTTLEYRENALLWLAFTAVYHATSLATLWIVLERFPDMRDWNFREMAFLYSLWMLAHALNNALFSAVSDVPERIRDGDFDRLLVRPIDPLFGVIATPGQVFPDELILAMLTFIAATIYAGIVPTLGFVVCVPLIVVGGALINFGIELAVSTLAFWFVRVDGVRWLVLQLESEFTRYPLGVYARPVRYVLTFVLPFAFVNYFPAAYLLHKDDATLGLPLAAGLATPLIGLLFAALAYAFWRAGLDRYQGVGH
jgi:ABC-2 type transport system permease protein